MNFKIGDYVVDEFGNIFLLENKWFRDIANANSEKFRLASKKEIEKYNARQLMGV